MSRSKYINTFNTTAEYDNYIESAVPEFPNVGYDKQAGVVNIRRQSPNNYQIWGTTTATSNFNIKLNGNNVEVTVDTLTGEFYLQGWTGTLTSFSFQNNTNITSIKKFDIDTSNVSNLSYSFGSVTNITYISLQGCDTNNVTDISSMFRQCSNLKTLDLSGCDFSNVTNQTSMFIFVGSTTFTDVYITVEATLMKLTNNLSSQGTNYIPSSATIHYNDVDYVWSGSAWTIQS